MNAKLKGTLLASAMAGLFACASTKSAEEPAGDEAMPAEEGDDMAGGDEIKCMGLNECKGQGECGGAGNDCAGKNECAGKGWVMASSEADCTDKGGTVLE